MVFGGHQYLRPIAKAGKQKQISEFYDLARRMEPEIAKAFQEAMDEIRKLIPEQELANLIERGDFNEIIRRLDDASVSNLAQRFSAAMSQAAMAGASLTAEMQPAVIGQNGIKIVFQFNPANPHVSDFANAATAHRIREISEDLRAVIREVIRAETMAGVNPRTTARIVRQSIGLTARQVAAVRNFRRMLEELDPEVLTRALRDKRFDRAVLRAIRDQQALSAAQVNRMVARYRDRYLKYRAEVIARTEAIRSIQGGARALYQSYVDAGRISANQIRRFWHYTHDARTRDEHRMIPGMNPDGVGFNEPFQTPLGPLMFPADPAGAAANTINCRCTVFTRVVAPELVNG